MLCGVGAAEAWSKEGGEGSAGLPGSKWLCASEEFPHATRQATRKEAPREEKHRVVGSAAQLGRQRSSDMAVRGPRCSQLQPSLGQWVPGVRQRTRGGFWDFRALTLGQGYHC